MKPIFVAVITIVLLLPIAGRSQGLGKTNYRKNSLFVELGGISPFYSINLDHIFFQRESVMLSYRIGVSVLPRSFSIPLGVNIITGRSKHHAVFTLAGSFYVEEPFTIFNEQEKTDKMVIFSVGGGYRYQKPEGGFFFTIGLAPLLLLDPPSDDFWNMDMKFYPSGNVGVGFSF